MKNERKNGTRWFKRRKEWLIKGKVIKVGKALGLKWEIAKREEYKYPLFSLSHANEKKIVEGERVLDL
jgi:hypothetical protein